MWVLGYAATGQAFEPLDGKFTATTSCPAVQSIKKGTNPGGVKLRVSQSYRVTGLNEPDGAYVQVQIPGARPDLRWVRLTCGKLGSQDGPDSGKYVLAISWQPAFCETRPEKSECRTQVPTRFDADHFTLHGLWPQPDNHVFCGVSAGDKSNDSRGRWDALPEPAISPETRDRLKVAMPGTASNLQRHEFTKHGTCFPDNADTYFRVSLGLLEQINASKLRDFMGARIGKTVSTSDLKQEFEKTFGAGTGAALGIRCIGDVDSRRTLINEIQINLKGTLTAATRLRDALDTSIPAHTDCAQGVVDPVGLN
jgi:ribonuclease T2